MLQFFSLQWMAEGAGRAAVRRADRWGAQIAGAVDAGRPSASARKTGRKFGSTLTRCSNRPEVRFGELPKPTGQRPVFPRPGSPIATFVHWPQPRRLCSDERQFLRLYREQKVPTVEVE
jgi:hypothetical protein